MTVDSASRTRRAISRVRRVQIPHADEVDLFATDWHRGAGVAQHLIAVRDERRRHVPVIVVIAKDGKDAKRCHQSGECFRARLDIVPIAPRHIVATEHDQIRPLRLHQRDRAHHVARRDHFTVVEIGNESNAKAVEGGAETGRPERWREEPESDVASTPTRRQLRQSACPLRPPSGY